MSVEFLNSIRNFSSAVKNNDFSISMINPDSSIRGWFDVY